MCYPNDLIISSSRLIISGLLVVARKICQVIHHLDISIQPLHVLQMSIFEALSHNKHTWAKWVWYAGKIEMCFDLSNYSFIESIFNMKLEISKYYFSPFSNAILFPKTQDLRKTTFIPLNEKVHKYSLKTMHPSRMCIIIMANRD